MDNSTYRDFTLDNGLHVILQNTPTKTIFGRLRVNYGSLHERPGEQGLAHLLEHLILVGGSQKHTPEESDLIRSRFGYMNATTQLNQTLFPVGMVQEDLEAYLDLIAHSAAHPRIDEGRFQQEKLRVLREIAEHKSDTSYSSGRDFYSLIFGNNSPHLYDGFGNETVIQSVTREHLLDFHHRGYNASNMDLILVGDLPKGTDDKIASYFKELKGGESTVINMPRNFPIQGKYILHKDAPELLNQQKPENSNANLNIAFFGPNDTDAENVAVQTLVQLLGGDASSRLYRSVSRDKGFAYRITSQHVRLNNTAVIYINSSLHAPRLDEAIDEIFLQMRNLGENPVPDMELERWKKQFRYSMAKQYETNEGLVQGIAYFKEMKHTLEEYLDQIDAITPEVVQLVAQRYLPGDRDTGNYVMLIYDPLRRKTFNRN